MTKVFILTGPSGAGKSTVLDRLMKRKTLRLSRFTTTTTRPRRRGERNGREYWFLDEKTFLAKKRRGDFFESAKVYGRWYGSDTKEMRRLQRLGRPIIMLLNVAGARTLQRLEPDSFVIFLDASRRELVHRLAERGKQVNDLEKRIAKMTSEESFQKNADVVIQSGGKSTIAETVRRVANIIREQE